jgi:hypothetical protein
MPTPVPPEVLAAARAAAEDSLVRYAAGDTSVTDEEALVYRNLIHALKLLLHAGRANRRRIKELRVSPL